MNNFDIKNKDKNKIAIIGLGYVGLPLAVEFGSRFITKGFDINKNRIEELKNGRDKTNELTKEEIDKSSKLQFTSDIDQIKDCNIYVVTVPTPVDKFKNPDLDPLKSASRTIGALLSKNNIVIYESTVFPGATEEVCVPILEETSSLKYNEDFYCGYSPERINPADKEHVLTNVVKVTSGSNKRVSKIIDDLYKTIIKAGTHRASSIKIAEAAKIIENVQRDVNIALMNELHIIFDKMGIDTKEVLKAASTKWNFLNFHPGLVGGHCIGVDPYYLTYKSKSLGYHPEIILSGRRINDSMGKFIAQKAILQLAKMSIDPSKATIGIYGITFKPDCPDIRNTKVVDIITELQTYNCKVFITDPIADPNEVKKELDLRLIELDELENTDLGILAVNHKFFFENKIHNKKNILKFY